MRRWPQALALFFASGVAGLVYQVMWVRGFGHVFGNTIASAALVTAVFMCGLGVGSVVAGRFIDRRRASDGLLFYGYAELAIAALGLGLALLLPRMSALSASLFSYSVDAAGWHTLSAAARAFQYIVAIVALGAPCLLMGGTLTLLIRYVVADYVQAAGWRVGLLYGLNTAGAAAGALLTDFALVPRVGIFNTQLVAVALNVAAGIGAVWLARGARVEARAPQEGGEPDADGLRVLWLTCGALVLSGAAALGLEILWFRYLSQLLGSLRSTFSLIVGTMLVAMWLGSTAGGYLHRKLGKPVLLLMISQALLVVSGAALLFVVDHETAYSGHLEAIRPEYLVAATTERSWLELSAQIRPIATMTALPAFAMGFVFPLANAHAQRSRAAVGGHAGFLYLAITAGNVIGSVATGFFLLDSVGIRISALLLLACAGAAIIPIYVSARKPLQPLTPHDYAFAGCLLVAALGLFIASQIRDDQLLQPCIPDTDGGTRKLVTVSEGPNETIAVTEVVGLERTLFTNGHRMSETTPDAQRYMRAFAHIPLLQMDEPKRALVICFGVGNTLHAASLHPGIERLEVADLSRNVLDHAVQFEAANRGVLRDPRAAVFLNDGRLHLRMTPEGSFDLITLEPPPVMFAGVAALYSREFYRLARSRLTDNGFLTQWLPAQQVEHDAVLSMVRAFIDVFPESVLLSGAERDLILMGTRGTSIAIDDIALTRRLGEREEVQADLEAIEMGTPVEIFGSFVASHATLAQATQDVRPVTDEDPIIEYSQLTGMRATNLPPSLFAVTGIDAWCSGCTERVAGLSAHLRVRGLIYASSAFLHAGSFNPQAEAAFALPDDPELDAAVATSAYLSRLFGGKGYTAKRVGREHLEQKRFDLAISVLQRAIFLDRGDIDVRYDLGRAFVGAGNTEAANAQLANVLTLAPRHPRANAVMCKRAAQAGEMRDAARYCDVARKAGIALSPELLQRLEATPAADQRAAPKKSP